MDDEDLYLRRYLVESVMKLTAGHFGISLPSVAIGSTLPPVLPLVQFHLHERLIHCPSGPR